MMPSLASAVLGVLLAMPAVPRTPVERPSGWVPIGPSYPMVSSVSVASDAAETLYAAASDDATAQSGVFRSGNGGASWILLGNTLPGDMASSVAVDPRDARRVFATTVDRASGLFTRLYESQNSGSTWQFVNAYPSACGGSFVFDAVNPRALYLNLFCSGEVIASEDGGLSWSDRGGSIAFLCAAPSGALYGRQFQDGLVRSDNGGFTWSEVDAPPCPYGSFIDAVAVNGRGGLFVGTGQVRMMFIDCPGLHRSIDGGRTWTQLLEGLVTGIGFDESRPSRIIASTSAFGSGAIFESVDDGVHWRNLSAPANPSAVVLSPSGRTLYAVTDEGLFRLASPETRLLAPR